MTDKRQSRKTAVVVLAPVAPMVVDSRPISSFNMNEI